jgi:hypothetical protein
MKTDRTPQNVRDELYEIVRERDASNPEVLDKVNEYLRIHRNKPYVSDLRDYALTILRVRRVCR